MALNTPEAVNNLWFGPDKSLYNDPNHVKSLMGKWFMRSSPELEETLIANASQIDFVANEKNLSEDWFTPEGYLARIVLLDQATRTVWRGVADGFKYDKIAEDLSTEIVTKGWFFDKYLPAERSIVIMPLMHSENIAAQDLGLSLASRIGEGAAPETGALFGGTHAFFLDHQKVVARFGRFPSRNAALGRANTPEEEEYLSSPDLPAWARSQIKK